MHFIIQTILTYVLLYKYWALFGITLVAALILPVPPGTLIMASSAFAQEGFLKFPFVLLAAIAGNIAGDNIGYFLAKRYGRRVLKRIGFKKIIESKRYASFERKICARPGWIIFVSRFEVFANLSVNIIAGMGKVSYKKYLLYEVIGEIVQVTLYGTIGYVVGSSWQTASTITGRVLLIFTLIAVVLIISFWKRIKRTFFHE